MVGINPKLKFDISASSSLSLLNCHNCLRHIFGLPMRWFSTQKDVSSYQYEIFHFHFLVRHNLKLDFSQFKTNISRGQTLQRGRDGTES